MQYKTLPRWTRIFSQFHTKCSLSNNKLQISNCILLCCAFKRTMKTFWERGLLAKKWLSPPKNFVMEISFNLEIFVLNYVLKRMRKRKHFSFEFNVQYIEIISVKFSTILAFSSGNFKFFQFSMNCLQKWKTYLP